MYKKNYFQIDKFDLKGSTFSVCVIQGHKEKTQVEYPEIIKKNLVMEVPENKVNLLSEFMAAKNEFYNELFTEDVVKKMQKFTKI